MTNEPERPPAEAPDGSNGPVPEPDSQEEREEREGPDPS